MRSKFFAVLVTLGLISSFLFGFAFTSKANAADEVAGITISPPLSEREVKLGESFSDVIRVTNPNATTSLKVTVSLEDFTASGEEGQQSFTDPETNSSSYMLADWMETETEFELKGNETKEIKYTITVPKNAEPGGHYGVIFFSPSLLDQTQAAGSGVMAVPKVGGLILLTVPGNIKYGGNVVEFKTDKTFFFDNENIIKFLTRFQNSSSVHVKVNGDITVKNIFGKEVTKITVNDTKRNTLPESISKFENEWKKKFGFLRYTAVLNLTYGNSQATSANLAFWIIPWQIILAALIALIIIIWIIKHLRWGGSNKNNKTEGPTTSPPENPPTSNVPLQ